jgi:hypothetical protein
MELQTCHPHADDLRADWEGLVEDAQHRYADERLVWGPWVKW